MTTTIPRLLAAAAERAPGDAWLHDTGVGAITFAGAAALVGGEARDLAAQGVRRGDVVMLVAGTTPRDLLCWLALTTLGAIVLPVNPRGTRSELTALIAQVRPKTVIHRPGPWPRPGELRADLAEPDDLAVLIPTSGTTGRSKLVMQTHRAYALAGAGFPYWLGLTRADRLMTSLPLFHINAPAYSVMGSLSCGAGLVLLPRFSASTFLDEARRHGATEFNAIGAMLEILMRRPPRPDDADNPIRLCYTGPAPSRERQLEIERRFGFEIVVGYALSETPYGLIWPRGTRPYETLGVPRQHPTLGVINHARVAEDGELLLRNPAVTPGYWGLPEESAEVLLPDGWLRTGDLVTANADGTYSFVARKKEVIRRRGENLSPLEVEETLQAHPGVLECAVVGVPSELTEEEVKAFVVAAPGQDLDLAGLRRWAAGRLAAYKVPRFWQRLDALPRTPTARVAKHLLPSGPQPDELDLGAG
ncbi:AMP-binding protein [Nonomuraea sp. NPDC050404]|uniref:AMP-binding protein n=1 Tax=Nonomuraea sp. NPDC050404 TaxID=3155783 RepID=UPI0033CF75AB